MKYRLENDIFKNIYEKKRKKFYVNDKTKNL